MLIPDCARVVHKGLVGSNEVILTFSARYSGAIGAPNLTDIAELHRDAFIDKLIPMINNSYTYQGCDTYDLGDPTAGGGTASGSLTAGGFAGGSAGTQVCAIATLKTAKRGKSFTGRSFFGPLHKDQVDVGGQKLAGTYQPVIQAAYDDYMSDVSAGIGDDGKLVVASAKLGTYEDVTSILVRSYLGTQRRRVN